MGLKRCRDCDRALPLTEEYYHRHRGRPDGFRETCRECRNDQRRKDRRERRQRAERTVILRLAKMIREGRDVPRFRQLFYEAYRAFGGAAGVARAMAEQFEAAKPGGMERAYLLISVARLAMEHSRRPTREGDFDPSRLSNEELEEAIQERIKLLVDLQNAGSRGLHGSGCGG